MRFVQLLLALLYVCTLLSGTIKSASDDWVDATEAQFYSTQLVSSTVHATPTENVLEEEKHDHPPILASHQFQWPATVQRTVALCSIETPALLEPCQQAQPRAPPVLFA